MKTTCYSQLLNLDRPIFLQEGLPFGDLCPAGHFCPAGTEDPRQRPCPAGTCNAQRGASDMNWCLSCPPGLFCARVDQVVPRGPCAPGEDSRVSPICHLSSYPGLLSLNLEALERAQGRCAQLSVAGLGRNRREAAWRPLVGILNVVGGCTSHLDYPSPWVKGEGEGEEGRGQERAIVSQRLRKRVHLLSPGMPISSRESTLPWL